MTCKCHLPFELLRYNDHGVVFSAAIRHIDDFLFRYQSKETKYEEGMTIELYRTGEGIAGDVWFPEWIGSIGCAGRRIKTWIDGEKYKASGITEWV
jgi:hypothetical protein